MQKCSHLIFEIMRICRNRSNRFVFNENLTKNHINHHVAVISKWRQKSKLCESRKLERIFYCNEICFWSLTIGVVSFRYFQTTWILTVLKINYLYEILFQVYVSHVWKRIDLSLQVYFLNRIYCEYDWLS